MLLFPGVLGRSLHAQVLGDHVPHAIEDFGGFNTWLFEKNEQEPL